MLTCVCDPGWCLLTRVEIFSFIFKTFNNQCDNYVILMFADVQSLSHAFSPREIESPFFQMVSKPVMSGCIKFSSNFFVSSGICTLFAIILLFFLAWWELSKCSLIRYVSNYMVLSWDNIKCIILGTFFLRMQF